jgi:RNA polymerase sigma factor (sigma-70 family)
MRATRTSDKALIVAAQSGDRRALDELVSSYLPLVYTIVRRALGGDPDVDDVVQEIMLRVVRQLRLLRDAQSFRPWLAAIAVRRVSTHLYRRRVAAARIAALDEAAEVPDADTDVEGASLLEVELSAQRRQVVRASRWIDPEDRALLSLWWLETAGQLTRADLAEALGVSVAHAGVRIQRMRGQLELSRSVVAALQSRPRCAGLNGVIAEWDGVPSPLWRKRIARHLRTCVVCGHASAGMVATERLLVGFALLPVPIGMGAALAGKVAFAGTTAALSGAGASGSVKAGIVGQLIQAVVAHPVAATIVAGALVVGGTVTATQLPEPDRPKPQVIAAPTARPSPTVRRPGSVPTAPVAQPPPVDPPRAAPRPGRFSLESANAAGTFIGTGTDTLGVLVPVTADSAAPVRDEATFEVVPGLADAACFSFRSKDGRYLRHSMWRVRLNPDDGTPLFQSDATFCTKQGAFADSVVFESKNYPGWFIHHRGDQVWVDQSDGTPAFLADSSFLVHSPLST